MDKEKRMTREAEYTEMNERPLSRCCGMFQTSKNKKPEMCKHCDKCAKYKRYKEKGKSVGDVKFHYIDTFRGCELYNEVVDIVTVSHNAIYNMLYVNDLACGCVVDMQPYIKDQDKETKKEFGALMKRMDRYNDMIFDIVSNRASFLADYNEGMDELTQKEFSDFKNAIYDFFRKNDVENRDFIASTEIARTMIGYAVCSVKNRIKECLKYDKDSISLQQYALNFKNPEHIEIDWDMLDIIESLSNWTVRKLPSTLNLNEDKKIIETYRALDKALTNRYYISESLYNAEKLCNQ